MTKFILLYHGPATPTDQMTEEEGKAVMAKWGVWMEKLGRALIDVGNPMENGVAVVDDGSAGTVSQLNGYSIVEAADINGAKKFAEDHPFLSDKSGKFRIEIFELMPM